MSKKNISTFGSWLYSQSYLIGENKNWGDIVDTMGVRNENNCPRSHSIAGYGSENTDAHNSFC